MECSNFVHGSVVKDTSPSKQWKKIKIKHVKHAFFVNHLCFVPPVENVHNVAQNIPLEGCLRDFLKAWASQGANP